MMDPELSSELGYVSLEEVSEFMIYGLKIERDCGFEPTKTLSQYWKDAVRGGSIDLIFEGDSFMYENANGSYTALSFD